MDLAGIGSVADFAKGIVDRFFPPDASPEQKLEIQKALANEIAARDTAKGQIIAAEMSQGDNYTKRARPTVVYAGLIMIAINHVVFPMLSRIIALLSDNPTQYETLWQSIPLPEEFWWAWGGTVSIWILGRSAEKKGAGGNFGKIASLITGNQK